MPIKNDNNPKPTVLVADDEEASVTVELLIEIFGDTVKVVGAASVSESLNTIEDLTRLDLIVLDMNFKERGGELGGIEILRSVKRRFPDAEVLVTTGYSESLTYGDMLQLADLGIRSSCWLCKGKTDEISILQSRVSRLLRHQNALSTDLEKSWRDCQAAGDAHAKGDSLERFATLFFGAIPGFICVHKNLRLTDQEFDIVIENNSTEPFWFAFNSPFVFVECKNTTPKVEADVVHLFWSKLHQHRSVTRLGFLLSLAGFTSGCLTTLQRLGSSEAAMILISGKDINLMFESNAQPASWLKRLVTQSIR